MRFSILTAAAVAVSLVSSAAIPSEDGGNVLTELRDASPHPHSVLLEARDEYDCNGSGLCRSLNVTSCDDAVNNRIVRDDGVNYGAPGSGRPSMGACSGWCGVFIQGKAHCARTGNQIWWDYQEIRGNNCTICGSKHWGDGCLTTINFVTRC